MPESIVRQTFVLVHGAWHGGWCWQHVVRGLHEAGHRVFAPTMTGLGERSHLLREGLTIQFFATELLDLFLAEKLENVILVGHSFGGAPISVVADQRPDLLKHLIYLDAVILSNGESPLDQLPRELAAERVRSAQETSGGLTFPPPPAAKFGIVNPGAAAWVQRRLTPHPLASYQEPIRLTHPVGNGVAKSYIACTQPAYPPFLRIHDWVRLQNDWQYLELACGHDAMVICPDLLVLRLLQCAVAGPVSPAHDERPETQ